MVVKTLGVAGATRVITNPVHVYTVWCESPGAFSDKENAMGANIQATGNIRDESQKNFEVLVQSIGLRAMPLVIELPYVVEDLQKSGAPTLNGEGYVWKFAVEMAQAFENANGSVGLLVEEIGGIVLPNGTVLRTKSPNQNIEFRYEGLK